MVSWANVRASVVVGVVVGILALGPTVACGSRPPPTSTTPATPGSAVILPAPVLAEQVPIGDPVATPASASASAVPSSSASH